MTEATDRFDQHDFRSVAHVCNDGITRNFRPFGIKDMLKIRRALPKIATDMPWLNFANFESPHRAILRTLAEMATAVAEMKADVSDGSTAAVRELCAAVRNADAASTDSASDEAIEALMQVLAILFSPEYCDKPLSRDEIENNERSPVSSADIPALMNIAIGLASLEKKARLAGKASPTEQPLA